MPKPLNGTAHDHWLDRLASPVKNHFFYGMLLTDEVFQTEQRYLDGKRWLINRLALGEGVLAGLDFDIDDSGTKANPQRDKVPENLVRLFPGVAVDGYGREIVVPDHDRGNQIEIMAEDEESHKFWPASQSLEFLGALKITKPADGVPPQPPVLLELQIASAHEPADPAPVKAGHCGNDCEPSKTRERFLVRVKRADSPPPSPAGHALDEEPNRESPQWPKNGNLSDVFPPEPSEGVQHRWNAQNHAALVGAATPPQLDKDARWVTLGFVNLTPTWTNNTFKPLVFQKVDRYYRQLFSNDSLSRLVFGLADRVDEASRVRILTYSATEDGSGQSQTGNVYQPLAKPLKVKIVNSNGAVPDKDLESIRVRFEIQSTDGGKLSDVAFVSRNPYDQDQPARTSIDVELDNTGLSRDVFWRLHKTPGPHIVSARIIPAREDDPPFHPGSQLLFHATARPTAPAIVGMELHDWHTPIKDECIEWKKGCAKLQIIFSRKMEPEELKTPEHWLRVWRIHIHTCDPSKVDYRVVPERIGADYSMYSSVGGTHDERGAWYVEYRLPNLLDHLHDHSLLRLLVAIRPLDKLTSVSIPEPDPLDPNWVRYPDPQQLSLSLAGSFLNPADRQSLWNDNTLAHHGAAHEPEPKLIWERFQPREVCWPSGNGVEGGDFPHEFHKTFEFRLPCGC